MRRNLNSTETAAFIMKEKKELSQEGHLKLGYLAAGLLGVNSSTIAQYERIKNSLLDIRGLALVIFPSHLTNVRLDKHIKEKSGELKIVLKQIDALIERVKKEDKNILMDVSYSIQRLTGVRLTRHSDSEEQSQISNTPN